jgi:hypothetical protein
MLDENDDLVVARVIEGCLVDKQGHLVFLVVVMIL